MFACLEIDWKSGDDLDRKSGEDIDRKLGEDIDRKFGEGILLVISVLCVRGWSF